MEVVIVTGASRGIGEALVAQLLSPARRVIGIARQPNDGLAQQARLAGAWLDWYLQDLADPEASDALARSIVAEMPRDASRYVLINNAGVLGPIGRSEALDALSVARALNINTTAAMAFTARFIEGTAALAVQKRVLNVSSGAGRNPTEGWSTYCASKAALDMFTRTVKLEQARAVHPVGISSLAPGVVDTAMQGEVRAQDAGKFPRVLEFREMKESAKLASAEDVARRIIDYLARADFGEREIDDLRNYA